MGSKKSSSASSSSTNMQDQRMVIGAGSIGVGQGGSYRSDYRSTDDNSTNLWSDSSTHLTSDSSSRYANSGNTDSSSRYANSGNTSTSNSSSTSTVVNYSGTDGETAAQMARYSADLLQGLGSEQTDAVRAVAELGLGGFDRVGGAFTNLMEVSGANQAKAWTHTIDKSAEMLDRAATIASQGAQSASALAGQAVASYRPADANMGEGIKYAAIAVAALVAMKVLS